MTFDCSSCLSKCNASCCYCVPIEKVIYNTNKNKIVNKIINTKTIFDFSPFTKKKEEFILIISKDMKCCFLKNDLSCAIHDDKPNICKAFGDETNRMLNCQ